MYTVDLNSDLGESFGNYKIGNDDKIIPLISSANVACGYHASDPVVMGNTLAMAKEAGIRIGAHPGFPDLMGFGRRNLSVSPAEAKAYVLYQLGALDAFCRVTGVKMQHVKPHGALYNMAAEDYALSTAICEGIKEFDSSLIVLALSGGQLAKAAQDMGLRTAMEVFADRAYEEDGTLVNRRKEGAVISRSGSTYGFFFAISCTAFRALRISESYEIPTFKSTRRSASSVTFVRLLFARFPFGIRII